MMSLAPTHVADIVCDAGGKIVGRTRLQKIVYLLTAAGLEDLFPFEYRHYGPFSDALVEATHVAELCGLLIQEEHRAQWGGTYSVFKSTSPVESQNQNARRSLINIASKADAIELELTATAIFLAKEGFRDSWEETARRKPEKAEGRLQKAKELFASLQNIETPIKLPALTT